MGKMKNFLGRMGRYQYAVAIAAFLLIICFLDQNNLMSRWKHRQLRVNLEKEIEYYEGIRDSSLRGLNQLQRDSGNLESIARERYGMHLPNEEVFIIE